MLHDLIRTTPYSPDLGCHLRRLTSEQRPPFGAALAQVPAGQGTALHLHAEAECFLILSGRGRVEQDGIATPCQAGDWLDLPAGRQHRAINDDPAAPLVFLAIWWQPDH